MERTELEAKTKAELITLAKARGLEVDNQSRAELVELLLSQAEASGEPIALTAYLESVAVPVGVQGILLTMHKADKRTLEGWNALVSDLLNRKTS